MSFQISLNLVAAILSIYLFLPGSFHPYIYKKIMNKYSHQYERSHWITKNTTQNSKFLYNNLRSRHAIKRDFMSYYKKDGDFETFMKKNKIDYVIFSEDLKRLYNYNSNCLIYIDKYIFEQKTKNFLRSPLEIELEIFRNTCSK